MATLGGGRWESPDPTLRESLLGTLTHPDIVDLVFFGSQAHGGRTNFSDIDAILIIRDAAADDPVRLRALRRSVLSAQHAVLRHQPMQHHGFEVVTPRLLMNATDALGLPTPALQRTSSLQERTIDAKLSDERADASEALRALVAPLVRLDAWPVHVWQTHRAVSMFELVPTLYLQSTGIRVSKAESFRAARALFEEAWWPYDVLEEVRAIWPRRRFRKLETLMSLTRNPWAAVAAWRRMREPMAPEISELLSGRLLEGLQSLVQKMSMSCA
jgi:hypothetical protein